MKVLLKQILCHHDHDQFMYSLYTLSPKNNNDHSKILQSV